VTRGTAFAIAAAALVALPALASAQRARRDYSWWGTYADARRPLIRSATIPTAGRWPDQTGHGAALGQPGRGVWHTPPIRLAPPRLAWCRSDLALAGAFTVALWVDAAQTRELARHAWQGYREANPILGPRPTIGQINRYTAVAGLAVLGVAAAVPAHVRRWLLATALAVETFTVVGTVREGIALRVR
jgi:hypothetical protein